MKSLAVHYKNKYPNGKIFESETSLDVYNASGDHCVSMEKNGAGQWVDRSEAKGCLHKHDLAPIPKDARLYKVVGGSVVKDEKYAERSKKYSEFLDVSSDKIMSCEELETEGFEFDEKQVAKKRPETKAAQ